MTRAKSPTPHSRPKLESPFPPLEIIFGNSTHALQLRRRVECIVDTKLPVLIEGETGTGKEVLARLIHRLSQRQEHQFVKIACPAIPATLFESELFGYEKGSFTGAFGTKPGKLERAHQGTLFLDEIGELELGLQSKLLQVLQDSQFSRIGGIEEKSVEVRLVCATNRNLEQEIAIGRFRQDLFYRINVVNLRLVPLRDRVQDIPGLIDYFIDKYNVKFNQRSKRLPLELVARLQRYHWPGNIRELENLIKRYVVFESHDVFEHALCQNPNQNAAFGHMSFNPGVAFDGDISLKFITKQAIRDVERHVILKCLQNCNWNRTQAARALKISYRALLYKIQNVGL